MKLNASAIMAAVIFLVGTVFSSGIVIQKLDTVISVVSEIKADNKELSRRLDIVERRLQVLDNTDIRKLNGYRNQP